MKYVSIDIETTGLDPNTCQIIEFGAVIDDLTKPLEEAEVFHRYVKHRLYKGEPCALAVNHKILDKLDKIDTNYNYCFHSHLMVEFEEFLTRNNIDRVLAAGKNFAKFDLQFLNRLERSHLVKFMSRSLDPAMLYFDPSIDDVPPSLKKCLERAGINEDVTHTAVEDALQVCKLLRAYYVDNDGKWKKV